MIRVALFAYVRLHREGIASLLAQDKRLHVTALTISAEGFPLWSTPPDVIVVDASLDGRLESICRIARAVRKPIVALGVPDDERDVIAFAESGILGFVEREASLEELVMSVMSAARREASFPPRIATTLLRRVSSLGGREAPADVNPLTVRERQVVGLISEGLSNKEIATQLYIEVATVKNHVHNILEKLQVTRRFDAVARLRLVESGDPQSAVVPDAAMRSIARSRAR